MSFVIVCLSFASTLTTIPQHSTKVSEGGKLLFKHANSQLTANRGVATVRDCIPQHWAHHRESAATLRLWS